MRDYSEMPAYAGDTPLDARFHYAMDLLHKFCPQYGTVNTPCLKCPFPAQMGAKNAKCCGWTVAQWQEEAIEVLEKLIEKRERNEVRHEIQQAGTGPLHALRQAAGQGREVL